MDEIVMHISENGQVNFTTQDGDPVTIRVSHVKSLTPWSEASSDEKRVAPGDLAPDGSVYIGLSPETGSPIYTTLMDQGAYSWADVEYIADDLVEAGHSDWRLPTFAELELIYKKKDMGLLKDSFDSSGTYYWSSDEDLNFLTKVKRFNDGGRGHSFKKVERALRCVRTDESISCNAPKPYPVDVRNQKNDIEKSASEKAVKQNEEKDPSTKNAKETSKQEKQETQKMKA